MSQEVEVQVVLGYSANRGTFICLSFPDIHWSRSASGGRQKGMGGQEVCRASPRPLRTGPARSAAELAETMYAVGPTAAKSRGLNLRPRSVITAMVIHDDCDSRKQRSTCSGDSCGRKLIKVDEEIC
ncbi:unnamed protein product [Ranitomeya imitator]|uniref:Uncharacterized protein n=1 Tax=Ranitomeya imitator TaxID=111125 RepID=A0ABN9LQC2_9NEOB|nr:unnamed protein product [Ranitomeya imitator]